MHALLLVAEAAEKSKTAWYVLGLVLAGWAVVIAAVGITQPDFPGKPSGRVAVILVSVVLVAAAMTAAVVTS